MTSSKAIPTEVIKAGREYLLGFGIDDMDDAEIEGIYTAMEAARVTSMGEGDGELREAVKRIILECTDADTNDANFAAQKIAALSKSSTDAGGLAEAIRKIVADRPHTFGRHILEEIDAALATQADRLSLEEGK